MRLTAGDTPAGRRSPSAEGVSLKKIVASVVALTLFAADAATVVAAQDYSKYSQEAMEKELARIATSRERAGR